MLSLTACCYLLFRKSNAIAPDVNSPLPLRRWTAAFLASMALSHVWYMPEFYLTTTEDILLTNLVGATLDFMTLVPLGIIVLLNMLQDHKRPLWPVFVAVAPLAAVTMLCAATCSITLLPVLYAYYLLLGIGLLIYMVREVRQYSLWLRNNYADLEHKEVWQSFVILAVILLFFGIYTLEPYYHTIKYIMQLNNMILVCYLLWRVETLSDLGITRSLPLTMEETDDGETMKNDFSPTATDKIGPLLQRHCIDTQLYLQHDLTLLQLAKAIGTNRYYLSQHFSRQGTTYNAYINGLRIQHFMNLYRKSVAFRQSFTAQQLAMESGFHNYRTFSNAFKHLMGLTVTGWIKNGSEDKTQQRLDAS
jgi:AraC-like DNA-binding protein